MKIYDDEKFTNMLEYLISSGVKERLSSWQKKFIGTCLVMNDKRIPLTDKQQNHLINIYRTAK